MNIDTSPDSVKTRAANIVSAAQILIPIARSIIDDKGETDEAGNKTFTDAKIRLTKSRRGDLAIYLNSWTNPPLVLRYSKNDGLFEYRQGEWENYLFAHELRPSGVRLEDNVFLQLNFFDAFFPIDDKDRFESR